MATMTVVRASTRERVGLVTWTGTEQRGSMRFEPDAGTQAERAALSAQFDAALAQGRKTYAPCLFITPYRDYARAFDGYWGTASALRLSLLDVMLDLDWNALDPPPPAAALPLRDEMERIDAPPESLATV